MDRGSTLDVLELLRDEICTGVLAPGTSLAQVNLAARFGVSRSPIRQALHVLASEGLVDLDSGATTVVTFISISELQELYEMREELEPLATRLAVPNVGRADVLQMRQAFDLMGAAKEPGEFLAANAAFHGILCAKAHRPRMFDLIGNLRRLTDRYLYLHLKVLENFAYLVVEHENLLSAVERRDALQAESLTRQHLETSHDLILHNMLDQSIVGDAAPARGLESTSRPAVIPRQRRDRKGVRNGETQANDSK